LENMGENMIGPAGVILAHVCSVALGTLDQLDTADLNVNFRGTHLLREKINRAPLLHLFYLLSGYQFMEETPITKGAGTGLTSIAYLIPRKHLLQEAA